MYNFDKVIDRSGSDDLKHGALLPRWGRDDLLPLWVADMDFETPSFITDALKARLEHSLFGYTMEPEDYLPSIIDWVRDHHQWDVKREWIRFIPGIVKGIGLVVNVFTQPDEKVIIQPPVYHPFRLTPEGNGREVVFNPLKMREDGYYEMDFENLEKVAMRNARFSFSAILIIRAVLPGARKPCSNLPTSAMSTICSLSAMRFTRIWRSSATSTSRLLRFQTRHATSASPSRLLPRPLILQES